MTLTIFITISIRVLV